MGLDRLTRKQLLNRDLKKLTKKELITLVHSLSYHFDDSQKINRRILEGWGETIDIFKNSRRIWQVLYWLGVILGIWMGIGLGGLI